MNALTVDEYLKLPYTIQVVRDETDGGWVAQVMELPGCLTQAETFDELGQMVQDAMRVWLEAALEDGLTIPEPRPDEEYSGKFVVRVPKSLHRRLVENSEREGASLNQYINVLVALGLGEHPPHIPQPKEASLSWPGLSQAARLALQSAGLTQEAGEQDEKLFASWLQESFRCIAQLDADGRVEESLFQLDRLIQSLQAVSAYSPLLQALVPILVLQKASLQRSFQTTQAIQNTFQTLEGLNRVIQQVNSPAISEEQVFGQMNYSQVTTASELKLADELFLVSTRRTR